MTARKQSDWSVHRSNIFFFTSIVAEREKIGMNKKFSMQMRVISGTRNQILSCLQSSKTTRLS